MFPCLPVITRRLRVNAPLRPEKTTPCPLTSWLGLICGQSNPATLYPDGVSQWQEQGSTEVRDRVARYYP